MGYFPVHWEDAVQFPPQGGLHVDREAEEEEYGWCVGLPPTGGGDDRGGPTGSGDLCRPSPEHGRTIDCDQDHYGPVSGGGVTPGDEGAELVVGSRVP